MIIISGCIKTSKGVKRTNSRIILDDYTSSELIRAVLDLSERFTILKVNLGVKWSCIRCKTIQVSYESNVKCSACKLVGRQASPEDKFYLGDKDELMRVELEEKGICGICFLKLEICECVK